MALGKVIGLDAGASWNPSIAVIPSYINNFDDEVFVWVSTESKGTLSASVTPNTYYTCEVINDQEVVVKRTSTTSGYSEASTTATLTITVGADATNGYAAMTRTVTIGPNTYTGSVSNIPHVLSQCSPAQIQAILNAGLHKNYWGPENSNYAGGVGSNTAAIKLNGTVGYKTFSNNSNFCAYILGFDHNATVETNGKNSIHFSLSRRVTRDNADAHVAGDIAFVDNRLYLTGSDAGFRMNLTNSNSGGWKMSYMRTFICKQFHSAIDPAWKSYIKP